MFLFPMIAVKLLFGGDDDFDADRLAGELFQLSDKIEQPFKGMGVWMSFAFHEGYTLEPPSLWIESSYHKNV